MPPTRTLGNDAPYCRTQDHQHLHKILSDVQRYNKCNLRSRRLMVIHVDHEDDFNVVGAFGTSQMVARALSSGFLKSLSDLSCSQHVKDSYYLPQLDVPNISDFVEAPLPLLETSLIELLSFICWPNREFFSQDPPCGWPKSVPFAPVYTHSYGKDQLLEVLTSLYAHHFSRILDMDLCVHASGKSDEFHFGICDLMSKTVEDLVHNKDVSIRFSDHKIHVGRRGVGFEIAKKETTPKDVPQKNPVKRRKRSLKDSAPNDVHRQIKSIMRRNAYSIFVGDNYAKVAGNFAERQKKLAEMWADADQGFYKVKLQKKKQQDYAELLKPRKQMMADDGIQPQKEFSVCAVSDDVSSANAFVAPQTEQIPNRHIEDQMSRNFQDPVPTAEGGVRTVARVANVSRTSAIKVVRRSVMANHSGADNQGFGQQPPNGSLQLVRERQGPAILASQSGADNGRQLLNGSMMFVRNQIWVPTDARSTDSADE